MILIAHRGNIYGSDHKNENREEYIMDAVSQGYYVEVDVWCVDNELYLGHDHPQYKTSIGFLKHEKIICHGKNIEVLDILLSNNIHCFSHDSDDAVLTSRCISWLYPGKEKDIKDLKRCIIVMPERKGGEWLEELISLSPYGICSDCVGSIREIEDKIQEDIYTEMRHRNTSLLLRGEYVFDSNLLDNPERSVAIVCRGDLTWKKNVKKYIPLNLPCLRPSTHCTFLLLEGMSGKSYPINNIDYLLSYIRTIPPFEVKFDRLIPVKTGLVICGKSSININKIRENIRNMGYVKNVPYKMDIIHSTVFRWSGEVSHEHIREWLRMIPDETSHYGTLYVEGFDIAECSYLMYPGTFKLITRI